MEQLLQKILSKVEKFEARINFIAERVERMEQKVTELGAYNRRSYQKLDQIASRTEEAVACCSKAFQMSCNAQFNLSEQLSEYAGTVLDEDLRVKII